MTKKQLSYVIQGVLFILFVGFLVHFFWHVVKLRTIYGLIAQLSWIKVGFLLALSCLIMLGRSYRLWLLLQHTEIKLSRWETIKIFIAGQAIAPLPGGEAARSILIHKEAKTSIAKSTGPLLALGFVEFMAATIIAMLGSLAFGLLRFPAFITLAILLLTLFLFIHDNFLKVCLQQAKRLGLAAHWGHKATTVQHGLKQALFRKQTFRLSRPFIEGFLLSAATSLLGGVLVYFIARFMESPLTLAQSVFIYTSSIVITSIAAISPGGLGFTEGGMTGILLLLNISVSKAIVIVLLFRALTLGFGVLSGIIFLLLFYAKPYYHEVKHDFQPAKN